MHLFLSITLCLFWNLLVVGLETSFTCNFKRDTCGFTNEEGHVANWQRTELNIGGRKGFVMAVEANSTSPHMARMSTPYFDIHIEQHGCFSFDWYTSGGSVRRLSVEQEHDYGITAIYVDSYSGPGWHKQEMTVDIDASTRFFFTATLNPLVGESLAAVSNMKLRLTKC